jgi:hypothetical protein
VIDRRENPGEDEPPVEIKLIEGAPVPATVGGPEDALEADEAADEPAADE